MQQSLSRGAGIAFRSLPLAITLWLVSMAFGGAFVVISGYWLDDALDGSLATRTLLRDLDPNVLIDLYYHHAESARMLLTQAALITGVYLGLWFWLHGAVVAAVVRRESDVFENLRDGLGLWPVMARLFVVAALVLAAWTATIGGAVWALLQWVMIDAPEPRGDLIVLAAGCVWILGYVGLVAVHDHARVHALRSRSLSILSYGWAFHLVLRGRRRAYLMALALNGVAVAVWAIYQVVEVNIPLSEELGMTVMIIWGELFVLARMVLRVWFFAAQAELQCEPVVEPLGLKAEDVSLAEAEAGTQRL